MRLLMFVALTHCLFSSSVVAAVKNFDKKFSLALVNEFHDFQLEFEPLTATPGVPFLEYEPNTTSLSGVQVSYGGLTLAYLTRAPYEEQDLTAKGKTSYEDIRGGLFLGSKKQWILLGYYNRFKGFYLENTEEVDPSVEPFLKDGDMESFNSGVSVMYVFDPQDFSASAAFVQSDQQTGSGGSFLAMASMDTNWIKGVSFTGVPTSVTDTFGEDSGFEEGKFVTSSVSLGYGHTFVWKNFFINFTLLLGYGYQAREFTVNGEEFSGTDTTSKQSYGMSAGYNGDGFFLTLALVQDILKYRTRAIRVSPAQFSQRLLLGVRF